MPRLNQRSPDAKTEKVTAPMSPGLYSRLVRHAASVEINLAEAVRRFVEAGLTAWEKTKGLLSVSGTA